MVEDLTNTMPVLAWLSQYNTVPYYRKLSINPLSDIGPLTLAIRDKTPREGIVFSKRVIIYLG